MCVEMSDEFWDPKVGTNVLFDWKASVVVRTRHPQVAKVTLNAPTWTWIRSLLVSSIKCWMRSCVLVSMLHYVLFACTFPHITKFFVISNNCFFTGLICVFLVSKSLIVLSESCSLRKRRFPSVSGTAEVGLYVRTNRQIWQGGRYGFRTKMANFADKKGPTGENFQLTYKGIIRGPVLINIAVES